VGPEDMASVLQRLAFLEASLDAQSRSQARVQFAASGQHHQAANHNHAPAAVVSPSRHPAALRLAGMSPSRHVPARLLRDQGASALELAIAGYTGEELRFCFAVSESPNAHRAAPALALDRNPPPRARHRPARALTSC